MDPQWRSVHLDFTLGVELLCLWRGNDLIEIPRTGLRCRSDSAAAAAYLSGITRRPVGPVCNCCLCGELNKTKSQKALGSHECTRDEQTGHLAHPPEGLCTFWWIQRALERSPETVH